MAGEKGCRSFEAAFIYLFMTTSFPAKLLLFGEHTVLKGSQALAIPFPAFNGRWSYCTHPEKLTSLQMELPDLLEYLQQEKKKQTLIAQLDLDRFKKDLDEGLYFESNIPFGYGLGSSGALCAALYHRYGLDPETGNLLSLKKALAQIESFFHGSSSGIDPLIIFLHQPVLIDKDGAIATTSLNASSLESAADITYFLLDTGIRRETGPLVQLFLKKCEHPAYLKAIQSQLSRFTNQAIQQLLKGQDHRVFSLVEQISAFQMEYFKEMIPPSVRKVWAGGLEVDASYKLKLCGAGGGGFLLGIGKKNSQAFKKLKKEFSIMEIAIRG